MFGDMKTKRLLFIMLVLFTVIDSANVHAQSIEGNFSVSPDPVMIETGGTAKVTINLSNYSAFTGYEFRLVLPEGISLKKAVENEDAYPTVYDDDKEKNVITHEMQRVVQEDGSFKFICISIKTTDPFVAGKMLTLTLEASSDVSGDLTASMKDIVLSSPTGDGPTPSDVNFIIRIQGKPTVTADNKTREYGDENPELTYTVSGGTITGTPTLSTTATITSSVGEYPISVAASDEYDVVGGMLTVTQAPLTISGGTYTIKQGEALPTITAIYTGFKNNETSEVLTALPILTLEDGVTGASEPGDYTITVAGGEATNYAITRENGTLTITAADPVTITAKNYTIKYGEDIPVFEFISEGAAVNGTPSITCEATTTSPAGTYPIVITKGTVTNYNATFVNGLLTIEAKTDIDSNGNTIVKDGVNVTLASIGVGAVAADGGLTIPDEITLIDENAFAGMTEGEKGAVTYVNLTNTNISGVTVNRENGLFAGFADNTLICLPNGNNDGGEANVVIGSTCRELVLDDDKGIVLPMDFTAQKVTYNRTLSAADEAYTICLPYSLSSYESVKFYELSASANNNLVFTEVASTDANKPYLVVPVVAGVSLGKLTSTDVKKNIDFDGAEKAVAGYKMLGTMKRISREDAMGFYILQDGNEWHPIGASSPATVSIPPYRAYIVGATGSARLFTMLGDDNATSIRTIGVDGSQQWYDMNGRKLSDKPEGKGAYIMNGKKVIMK